MAEKFKRGDVVALKSGNSTKDNVYKMTAGNYQDGGLVECIFWNRNSGQFEKFVFPEEALTKA